MNSISDFLFSRENKISPQRSFIKWKSQSNAQHFSHDNHWIAVNLFENFSTIWKKTSLVCKFGSYLLKRPFLPKHRPRWVQRYRWGTSRHRLHASRGNAWRGITRIAAVPLVSLSSPATTTVLHIIRLIGALWNSARTPWGRVQVRGWSSTHFTCIFHRFFACMHRENARTEECKIPNMQHLSDIHFKIQQQTNRILSR